MLSFSECQHLINKKLEELSFPEDPCNLYAPIRYVLGLGGKRIRPAMVLMACNIFTDHIENAVYPALALEVFHNFTLMHDDIMDRSDKRRNQPTVHFKWNNNIAILSGDAMMIKSYELLAEGPSEHLKGIFTLFNQTALEVCEGQQFDMDFELMPEITMEAYLKMIELKTAVLIATSLKMGSILADTSDENAELMYMFGKNLGMAFQLQDDLLDVYADPAEFGKATGNDIISNKKTFLLIKALELADKKQKIELEKWLLKDHYAREEKFNAVKFIYDSLGIMEITKGAIGQYYQRCIEILGLVKIDQKRKNALDDFIRTLINRRK